MCVWGGGSEVGDEMVFVNLCLLYLLKKSKDTRSSALNGCYLDRRKLRSAKPSPPR